MNVYTKLIPADRAAYEADIRERLAAGHMGDDVPIIMSDFGVDYDAACDAVFSGNHAVALALLDEAVAKWAPAVKVDTALGGGANEVAYLARTGDRGFVEVDAAVRCGYEYSGYYLYAEGVQYKPFAAIEVELASLPRNEAGLPILGDVIVTETGRFYRRAD